MRSIRQHFHLPNHPHPWSWSIFSDPCVLALGSNDHIFFEDEMLERNTPFEPNQEEKRIIAALLGSSDSEILWIAKL
jgi:hypothetical protein